MRYQWRLGAVDLTGDGVLDAGGGPLHYSAREDSCALRTESGTSLSSYLSCTAADAAGSSVSDQLRLQVSGTASESTLGDLLRYRVDERAIAVQRIIPDPPGDPPLYESFTIDANGVLRSAGLGSTIAEFQTPPVTNIIEALSDASKALNNALIAGGIEDPGITLR